MLRVSVLGGQQITDDRPGGVQARSSRALALIAYLAVHAGAPHPRQLIAGLLWPESGDAQALTNLRRELHHLRQVLGDDQSLQVTARDLCWVDAPTCRVDVRVFDTERAAALAAACSGDDDAVTGHGGSAIAEYRGDLLPGVYDDWLTEARARLDRHCIGAVRPGQRGPGAGRRPRRGGRGGAAPDRAAAAGGGRLPRADGTAGRHGRPGGGREHLSSLRLGA